MASFTERYHELTKYNPQTIDKLGPVHWEEQPAPFKEFQGTDKISLSSFLTTDEKEEGKKPWVYHPSAKAHISLYEIAHLLYFTSGITAKMTTGAGDLFLRANPSAGALYPTETYLAVKPGQEIPEGIYNFHPLHNDLFLMVQGNVWERLSANFFNFPQFENADICVLFSGIYGRSAWRYKERAYRRILLDTGHALGNLLEVCELMRLQAQLLAGFKDKELEETLRMTPMEEFPLVGVALSKNKKMEPTLEQPSSLPPKQAVQNLDNSQPFQVQQNQCERIWENVENPKEQEAKKSYKISWPLEVLKCISQRRSCREFSPENILKEDLQKILAFAYRNLDYCNWRMSQNFLESKVLVLRVDGMEEGIYDWDEKTHEFKMLRAGDLQSECFQMTLGQEIGVAASALVIHYAPLAKLTEKFGDRGYRYSCLDAGQIGERINLICMDLGLGSSGIGGYYDDLVNEVAGISLENAILYITAIGKPGSNSI